MAGRTFPEYYKWEHPDLPPHLVKMVHFATARFWNRKTRDWGKVDMDDLAETIDYHHFVYGVQYELITEVEAESVKEVINARSI